MLVCSFKEQSAMINSKKKLAVLAAAGMATCSLLSFSQKETPSVRPVTDLYRTQLQQLEWDLDRFKTALATDSIPLLQQRFVTCRTDYKKLEFAIEYAYPYAAHKMNGPAVLESEPGDANDVVLPNGLQVIETYLYNAAPPPAEKINKELDYLLFFVHQMQSQANDSLFTPVKLYYAVKLNLYRFAAKGLSGFDSPVALLSLREGITTLRSSAQYLNAYHTLSPSLLQAFDAAIIPLQDSSVDFNTFDRAQYCSGPYKKLLLALQQEQQANRIANPEGKAAVKATAASFYEPDAFDVYYFAPEGTSPADANRIKLGARLFNEKMLTQNGRTCTSCHKPELAYTDGIKTAPSLLHGDDLKRNTPTLLYAALQPALFFDNRVKYLEEQVIQVLNNKEEMHAQLQISITDLKQSKDYITLFHQAYPEDANPVSEKNMAQAISDFIRTLAPFSSRFDQFMRGNQQALTPEEQAGFNLFMGKAQCGTCHYQPLFNGALPPTYEISETEVIGVPGNKDKLNPAIDEDHGAYVMFPRAHKDHAFRTPTLRNIARTAPYMHNGIYATLEEVIDFYNSGGGQGLGIPLKNQTLSAQPLNLSPKEKKAIVAFLKALND